MHGARTAFVIVGAAVLAACGGDSATEPAPVAAEVRFDYSGPGISGSFLASGQPELTPAGALRLQTVAFAAPEPGGSSSALWIRGFQIGSQSSDVAVLYLPGRAPGNYQLGTSCGPGLAGCAGGFFAKAIPLVGEDDPQAVYAFIRGSVTITRSSATQIAGIWNAATHPIDLATGQLDVTQTVHIRSGSFDVSIIDPALTPGGGFFSWVPNPVH